MSVTQQFHTGTPVGRLTLHILLSFAQFEREIIRERTRDKQAAARRQGHWTGGYVPLGYDLDPVGRKLVVNPAEAAQVRAIFAAMARSRSIPSTLEEIARRGWRTKSWITQNGTPHTGQPFNEASLLRLLRNPLYAGWMSQDGQLYRGEQAALIGNRLWKRVDAVLRTLPPREPTKSNKPPALLQGILRCAGCGGTMAGISAQAGERRYRYYVCRNRKEPEARPCTRRYVGAEALEQSVIDQLRKAQPGTRIRQLAQDYAQGTATGSSELNTSLRSIIDSVAYDGPTGEVTIRLNTKQDKNRGRQAD